ncbi:hypothetical protein AGMMS50256_32590 [Betaproteobacteria bacterium]|nr:hypothetical protein AGMMS50256_32590 [Betaproteobacteria bacterium]
MWFLRLLGMLTLLLVGGGVGAYLLTRNSKYLYFSWRLFRYAVLMALLVFGLLILERVMVIPV